MRDDEQPFFCYSCNYYCFELNGECTACGRQCVRARTVRWTDAPELAAHHIEHSRTFGEQPSKTDGAVVPETVTVKYEARKCYMRESLIAFIESVIQRNRENSDYRKEFTITMGEKKIQFGYGYHDLSKVVLWPIVRTMEMEVLSVEDAVNKFLGYES